MKTHLIVKTDLEALKATKEKIVAKLNKEDNLKQYGDDYIEAKNGDIYFIKVVTSADYVAKLNSVIGKGYDKINIDAVFDEIKKLLDILSIYTTDKPKNISKIAPEATESPEKDDNEKDDIDIKDEQKNTKKVNKSNKK